MADLDKCQIVDTIGKSDVDYTARLLAGCLVPPLGSTHQPDGEDCEDDDHDHNCDHDHDHNRKITVGMMMMMMMMMMLNMVHSPA